MSVRKHWECGICGKKNPGDLGFCPRCVTGSLTRDDSTRPGGGLEHGSIPYFPGYHVRKAGFTVEPGMIPCEPKYPHCNPDVRP